MFRLKFTPNFSRQKDALLAETAIPTVAIPQSVEECLAGFRNTEPLRGRGRWTLWMESIRVVRPLLYRSTGLCLLATACAATSTLAGMQILKSGQTLHAMWMYALVFLAMNSAAQVWGFFGGRLRCWVGLGSEAHLASLISRKLLLLSAVAAARQSSGNLKTLITSDVRNVGQFLDNAVRNLIPAITALAVIGPLLVHFSGRPGLFGLFVMTMGIPISVGLNSINTRLEAASQGKLDQLTSLAGEWVKNVRLIRYLSWDDVFLRDVGAEVRKFMKVSVLQHFMSCLIYGISISWWMVSATGVILLSRVMHYPLDRIGFFGTLWLLTFMAGFFTHLPNTIRLYGKAAPSVTRIARLLAEDEQDDHLKPARTIAASAMPAKLIFDHVSFQYPDGKIAIDDLSLEISMNRQLAIIGEIGSGKTTLLKLLCGEFPPTSGNILVQFDTGEVRDLWSRNIYPMFRQCLAYVPQEAFVSSDLFHANITLSGHSLQSREEEISAAAYWAELEADLAALPQGLSQEIGESGVNLSGGQRQRLNLARAFFSQRPYMVLDDTMSAVDTKTETALMERLLTHGKGFALVTHRTGELLRVEDLIVMKDGKLVEHGSPKVLASQANSHVTRVLRAYDGEDIDGLH